LNDRQISVPQFQQLPSHLEADARAGGFAGGEDDEGGFGDAEHVTVCVRLNGAPIASAQSSTFNASKLFS
jgi:hypothetical protein